MSETKYRLPDWLGGHEVHVERVLPNGWLRVWVRDHESTPIEIALHNLVEVKPPSVDDPVEWPLEIDRPSMTLTLRSHTDDPALLAIENHAAVCSARLSVEDLRDLARAAWQRANAVEAGES